MNHVDTLLTLAGVLLLSVASPGPNFVLVTTSAMGSRRAGVVTGFGLAAASGTWATIAIAGLSLIVAHAPWIETVLRVAGAVYLIWLGMKMLWTARQPLAAADRTVAPGWGAAKKGYFVSMTNPKAIAFYGSIFSVMVPAHAPLWLCLSVVGLAIGISCGWYCAMALLASHPAVNRILVRRKAAFEATAGVLLMGLGGRLLAGR